MALIIGVSAGMAITSILTKYFSEELGSRQKAFSQEIDSWKSELNGELELMGQSADIAQKIKAKDFAGLQEIAQKYRDSLGIEAVTLLDAQGRVLASTDTSLEADATLADNAFVTKALSGEKTLDLDRVKVGDSEVLAFAGAVAVNEPKGDARVGAVYAISGALSSQENIEEVSRLVGSGITVFDGDTRVATTLANRKGEKIVGTKFDNASIKKLVLDEGKTSPEEKLKIEGQPYMAFYVPLKSETGGVLGMYGIATSIGTIYSITNSIVLSLIFIFVFVSALVFLVIGVNLSRATLAPVKSFVTVMKNISHGEGDLTMRINNTRQDEIGELARHFDEFAESIRVMVESIKNNADALGSVSAQLFDSMADAGAAVNQISSNLDAVKEQTQNQASGVTEASSAVEEVVGNIASLDELIASQAESVAQSSAAVEEMIANNASVTKRIEMMAERFEDLLTKAHQGQEQQTVVHERVTQISSQSQSLLEANSVIAHIASQTNLLAMNAAIEAAHAGEAGRGFSVVADEIRSLAENSSQQSKNISQELKAIQESIKDVVLTSNNSQKSFELILSKVEETNNLVSELRLAMDEEAEGSRQINQALARMNEVSSQVREGSAEMKSGNRMILEEMSRLQEMTLAISNAIGEIAIGTKRINSANASVSEASDKTKEAIKALNEKVGRFKV
jgi:methyl-accepting chemotaxis protein